MLFAMGGYGTYLGFRIRFSDDVVITILRDDLEIIYIFTCQY